MPSVTKRMRSTKQKTRKHVMNTKTNIYKQIIPTFLHMLNTVKLYHWKTTSYSTHKATDELYSDLNKQIDEFVEILLGKSNIAGGKNRNSLLDVRLIKLHHYNNNEEFKKQIEHYKTFLINISNNSTFNIPSNTDLINKRDELLALMNQFLYLLTLKN
jgi:DNA-binding ferritin-like protein